ncbi:hypothetical protein [Paenibacillus eucommiae]|uniref:Uncharacterized protein n=1 Tax=Paenibacillus eucommiae TaxID=1355755 RepID=A0ABS4IZA2_9BACL|nr:hypothetical protein [Paenibacillus eucommiae]MBP1992296.1 hypothetical protein [Paenibacillus eucommiae]
MGSLFERAIQLTMFFIVKVRLSSRPVTLMMIFIVKRGWMASKGG